MKAKYAAWGVNKVLTNRPYSSALQFTGDDSSGHRKKMFKYKPKRKHARSGLKRKRNRRMTKREKIETMIRVLITLAPEVLLNESHIRDAERILGLPVIRLRLDAATPFSSLKGRKTRIYDAICKPPSTEDYKAPR